MNIYEARDVMNERKHNGIDDYIVKDYGKDSIGKIVDGEVGSYRYTEFEAIAIAEKYEKI